MQIRALTACVLAAFCSYSFGAVITLQGVNVAVNIVDPETGESVGEYSLSPEFTMNEDRKTYSSEGSQNWTSWGFDWNMTVDPDPFISAGFDVINNAAIPQLFTVTVSIPIIPQLPSTLHGGSVGVTLTDANFDGLGFLIDVGAPIYQGLIDGAPVLGLYSSPFALSVPFAGGSATAPADSAGLPGPTLPSGPAFATIGITHNFVLSPGDRAAFTSFFVIEAIPEASTFALCGVGGMGIATLLMRRRKS